MYASATFYCLFSQEALEAHHKLSRKFRRDSSSKDAGPDAAVYYLPNDRSGHVMKQKKSKEPTSLLQYFLRTYAPLLMRISIPEEIHLPTHSLLFPKFDHPRYYREIRESEKKRKRI
jgi:hypothetical protein